MPAQEAEQAIKLRDLRRTYSTLDDMMVGFVSGTADWDTLCEARRLVKIEYVDQGGDVNDLLEMD